MKKLKIPHLIPSLLTLLPTAAGLVLWDKLPDKLPTHWDITGAADGWSSKALVVFGIPLILLAIVRLAIIKAEKGAETSPKTQKSIAITAWIVPIAACFLACQSYAYALGRAASITALVTAGLGAAFLFIGPHIKNCAPSRHFGIRIPTTRSDDANWAATHKFASPIFTAGGAVLIVLALMLGQNAAKPALMVFAVVAAAPIIYSCIYAAKNKKQ